MGFEIIKFRKCSHHVLHRANETSGRPQSVLLSAQIFERTTYKTSARFYGTPSIPFSPLSSFSCNPYNSSNPLLVSSLALGEGAWFVTLDLNPQAQLTKEVEVKVVLGMETLVEKSYDIRYLLDQQ